MRRPTLLETELAVLILVQLAALVAAIGAWRDAGRAGDEAAGAAAVAIEARDKVRDLCGRLTRDMGC